MIVVVAILMGGIDGYTYLKNQSSDIIEINCEDIQGQGVRDQCYLNIANIRQDLSVCNRIQGQETRDLCYTMVADTILTSAPNLDNNLEPVENLIEPISNPINPDTLIVKLDVPFVSQAPFGEWSDPYQQNGCEEASAIMAVHWAKGIDLPLQEAKEEIIAISDWQNKQYGIYQDTSAYDTVKRIFKEYLKYQKVEVVDNINSKDVINELVKGNLVIVPANGRVLNNPSFKPPGPVAHMLVIIGYDYLTEEFITNEPGINYGKDYRYDADVMFEAFRDYPTGNYEPINTDVKTMIIVRK